MVHSFETQYCQILVEEILYRRDRNPKKNWGHIWGLTTIYSYSRWKPSEVVIYVPRMYVTDFISTHIDFHISNDFSPKELEFLEKYNIFCFDHLLTIHYDDSDFVYPKIQSLIAWHQGGYLRKYLESHLDDPLFAFLYAISKETSQEHDYYFCFCESIDEKGIQYLYTAREHNPENIFVNIAIASYLYQHPETGDAEIYFLQALQIDKHNPWILAKYAMYLLSKSDPKGIAKAEMMMHFVRGELPDVPWVYDWLSDIYIQSGRYLMAIQYLTIYDNITIGKYRTYEPYMKFAEVYLQLGNLKKAREYIQMEGQYYFGEGYHERLEKIKKSLRILESLISI